MRHGQGTHSTSRRAFVSGAVTTAAIGSFASQMPMLAAQGPATPEAVASRTVEAPHWIFQLHGIQDPYAGTLQVPQSVPATSRVIAAEVEVSNDADQALDFTPIDVRLRDAGGQEYRGGAAIGAEPMISPRNLNPGERSRGWIWFIVPADADVIEISYVAPPPQFRIPLS